MSGISKGLAVVSDQLAGVHEEVKSLASPQASSDLSPVKQSQDNEWGEIVPLKEELEPVQKFDFDMLPDAFMPWVQNASYRMQSAPDFIAVGLMVSLSAILGKKIRVRPKKNDTGWKVTPNLWAMLVGRSSAMKTPSLTEALNSIRRMDKDARDRYKEKVAKHLEDKEITEIKAKELQKDIRITTSPVR